MKVNVAGIYERNQGKQFVVLGVTKDRLVAIVPHDYEHNDTVLIVKETDITNESKYKFLGSAVNTHKEMFNNFLSKLKFRAIKMDSSGTIRIKMVKNSFLEIV